jgi:hypothetical protein
MFNRCRRPLAPFALPLAVLITGTAALVGCGGDELSDKEYGFIDLAPYFYDGSSSSNPTAGLPREMLPQKGWVNGLRAEYYDFGLANSVKRRNDTAVPDYAQVPPMYFFFDDGGRPMFSKPVWEPRTALWHMRGGRDVLNPNPRGNAPRNVPYSVRVRDYLVDPARGNVADYQRPIIDRIQHNGDYTGLWEIVEVTVTDSGYIPDAVKSFETLQKGIDSGAFEVRKTGKVINCPVLDDRTYVTPTAMLYGMPRPQIELWYRTKRGRCFLADGWPTLGDANGNLFNAKQDARRVQTFDIINYTVGDPMNPETLRQVVVAPFSRMYVPAVRVANQDPARSAVDIRYVHDNLTEGVAKRNHADPPGYRPIRWLWDVRVPQDPPYEAGTYKSMDAMDPSLQASRGAWTRNFPLIGVAVPCADDSQCAGLRVGPGMPDLQCNRTPSLDIHANELPPITAGRNPTNQDALSLQREGGPRCDLPAVRYGEFCAPGVARCQFAPENPMGPYAKPAVLENGMVREITHAATGLVGGYTCQPMNTGYCFFRCDTEATATLKRDNIMVNYSGPANQALKQNLAIDSDVRCGNLLGYRCLNPATSPTAPVIPTKNRVCLRQCSTSNPDSMNDQFCGRHDPTKPNQFPVVARINEKVDGVDITKGQTCSNRGISGVAGCQWDPAYEPRDPVTNFVPR